MKPIPLPVRVWPVLVALTLGLLLPSAGRAQATPRDELIRLVPDDVGICLILNDLRGQHEKLVNSPWIKKVRESPLGKALAAAPELAKLQQLKDVLEKRLKVTWAELRDEILGDAVVFAYRPGSPGKPEEEQGILLLKARNAKLLARVVDQLNQEQKQTGELKELQIRAHQGVKYHRRVEAKGETFYFLDGPVLAFSAHEAMLRQVVQRHADRKAAALPVMSQLRQAGTEGALATLWVNPRAFDDDLQHQATNLQGPEAHVLKTFLNYWKALDGVSLSLTVQRDPEVLLTLHARTDALPAPARKLVAEMGKPSELWGRFPRDSVLTAAARVDVPALFDTLGEFLTPEARKALAQAMEKTLGIALHNTLVKQFLPSLGPDCGLCIVPAKDSKNFPHVLLALRVRPGPKGEPVDKVLMGAVWLSAQAAALNHNLKHKKDQRVALRTQKQGSVEVHYFTGNKQFPPGFQPAFALKDGYLLFASSPEAVRLFGPAAPPAAQGKDAPLLRLQLQKLGVLLKERGDLVLDFLAAKDKLPREKAEQRLQTLLWGLELFESLELTQRGAEGQTIWIARLRTAAVKE